MHAPVPKPEAGRETRSPHMRPLVFRLVVAWLAVVLTVGLWQGYAQWLLGSGGAHVP